MKKLFFLVVIFSTISFCASAQTKLSDLFGKIKSAPLNEYGVQRVNYGMWDTASAATNTWAYYNKRDGFILCRSVGGKVSCFSMEPKPNQERAEKILKEMDPAKWEKVVWY